MSVACGLTSLKSVCTDISFLALLRKQMFVFNYGLLLLVPDSGCVGGRWNADQLFCCVPFLVISLTTFCGWNSAPHATTCMLFPKENTSSITFHNGHSNRRRCLFNNRLFLLHLFDQWGSSVCSLVHNA